MDPRTHIFLTSHLHAAPTNGGGSVLVGIAVVFGCSLFFFAIAWLMRGEDDSDEGPGWGRGGSGPSRPSSPPSCPSWWPDFEREFARYAASRAAGRSRSRELVKAAPRESALAPPER